MKNRVFFRFALLVLVLLSQFKQDCIAQPGSIDTTFHVGTGFDRAVKAIIEQSDGKILVAGEFKHYDGVAINGVARLLQTGELDTTFKPVFDYVVAANAMALQSDGKVIIGGLFMRYGKGDGASNPLNILRLNNDGTIDTTFDVGTGFSPIVHAITLQPDGKILVGGDFTKFNGRACGHIVRLNKNGSMDPSFQIQPSYDKIVFCIAVQADEKIITSGRLKYLDYDRNKLVQRLNKDGSLDTSFKVGRTFTHDVWAVKILSDGKIMASGGVNPKDTMIRCIATRLISDGRVDTSFYLPKGKGQQWTAYAFAIPDESTIIISGYFALINGQKRRGVIRVYQNGSVDSSFYCVEDFSVNVRAIYVDAQGRLLTSGASDFPNSAPKKNISRLWLDSSDKK